MFFQPNGHLKEVILMDGAVELDPVDPAVADFFEYIAEGTTGGIDCQWCGTHYPERDILDDSYWYIHFAGKQVVQCCFEKLALALINFMPRLVPWYMKQIEVNEKLLDMQKDELRKMLDAIKELTGE